MLPPGGVRTGVLPPGGVRTGCSRPVPDVDECGADIADLHGNGRARAKEDDFWEFSALLWGKTQVSRSLTSLMTAHVTLGPLPGRGTGTCWLLNSTVLPTNRSLQYLYIYIHIYKKNRKMAWGISLCSVTRIS